ncbi:MAG: hypothetical protein ACKN83_12475 [Vulcanococcus sp.]
MTVKGNNEHRSAPWLGLQLGLGLLWIVVLATAARTPTPLGLAPLQVAQMLLLAGWLPSIPLALWQARRRRWRALLLSDLLGAGLLVLLACTLYLPLFFFHVAWFVPLALLPRGVITEALLRLITWRRP